MEPWQQRVVKERDELDEKIARLDLLLDEKIARLDLFLDGKSVSTLPHEDYLLLTNQRAVMVLYCSALDRRIARFSGKKA